YTLLCVFLFSNVDVQYSNDLSYITLTQIKVYNFYVVNIYMTIIHKKLATIHDELYDCNNYFTSTLAPASSTVALISSASSLSTPSLIAFGAASVKSFASFNPKPVISRTALTTLIFDAPASSKTTSKSVCSSAASAPPAAPPATATGAAAVTPNSSSIALTKSFNSNTVISFTASIICSFVI